MPSLFSNHFFQITGFLSKITDLIAIGSARRITSKPPLARPHEVLRPIIIYALRDTLTAT
ncbi:hypothetical protein CHN51_05775 [Sphingorhabdus sp. YGSMI21]|nr:hypothetical protein CHN51_05775 [Sphingorhabdus sp. YGSMI21]